MKKRILFLCTGNSCRSQMAEGFANQLLADSVHAFSAGITTHGLNPHAVAVMSEEGVDISKHYSKNIDQLNGHFDLVVTVCDNAHETCPFFPGRLLHHSFPDPPYQAALLAKNDNNQEEQLDCYRRVRNQIKDFIQNELFQEINKLEESKP